jgi:hypothetical protein
MPPSDAAIALAPLLTLDVELGAPRDRTPGCPLDDRARPGGGLALPTRVRRQALPCHLIPEPAIPIHASSLRLTASARGPLRDRVHLVESGWIARRRGYERGGERRGRPMQVARHLRRRRSGRAGLPCGRRIRLLWLPLRFGMRVHLGRSDRLPRLQHSLRSHLPGSVWPQSVRPVLWRPARTAVPLRRRLGGIRGPGASGRLRREGRHTRRQRLLLLPVRVKRSHRLLRLAELALDEEHGHR